MKPASPGGARRGRPARSEQQAETSRSLAIEAARKLFAAEGYEGVSMRKIATMAQCSPAALYTLFPSKRQLLRHIWEAVFAALVTALEHAFETAADADRLETCCLVFIDFWLQRPDDYRAIFLIEDRLQDAEDRYFVDSAEVLPRLTVFRRCIVDAQARGELRAGVPEAQQNILFCGIQGIAFNLITIPEYPWGDPDELKRQTLRALLAGLR